MNKRIRELAEQAGLLGPTSRVGNAHEEAEKFAELIVQECKDIAFRRGDNVDYVGLTDDEIDKLRGYPISRNLGEIMWVRTIEQAIKEKNHGR
jgi:hypothetical protein